MRLLIGITLIIVIVGAAAPVSRACFCVVPDVPDAFERASAVFVGKVTDIIPPRTHDKNGSLTARSYVIKFKVERSWKGVSSQEVSVLSVQGGFECFSYPAVYIGEKYLVYADPLHSDSVLEKGLLEITICNRTALLPELNDGTALIVAPKRRLARSLVSSEVNRKDGSEDIKILERMEGCGCLLPNGLRTCKNVGQGFR